MERYTKLAGWPALRTRIIHRDRQCRLCEVSIDELIDFEVDHIRPIADGGDDDPVNLRLLCERCHKSVTAEWRSGRVSFEARTELGGLPGLSALVVGTLPTVGT